MGRLSRLIEKAEDFLEATQMAFSPEPGGYSTDDEKSSWAHNLASMPIITTSALML